MKKLLLLTTLAVFAAACGTSNETANAPVNAAPPANSQPANAPAETTYVPNDPGKFTAGENPKSDVVYATRKQMTATQWSLSVTSSTLKELNMSMEHVAPDRYHFKRPDGEVIVIGKDSYVNRGGKWTKIPDDLSASIVNSSKMVTEESLQRIKDVKKLREEKFAGKDAIVYSYDLNDEDSNSKSTTNVWIDKATGLPLKIELSGVINGEKQTVTSTYDYDKKVAIEAPKVVE